MRSEATRTLIALSVCWLLAFWMYLTGFAVPHGDFFGSYLTESTAWWSRGGVWNPPQWHDHVWMGYPAPALLQNGAYYLPVGAAHAIAGYAPWPAAVLSSLHVAWGAIGCYVLARSLGVSANGSLLAMVAYFFGPVFFANAQHLDFVWGAAWIPWVMLVASPLWPWSRWWAVIGGSTVLALWFLGAYPGQLVMGVYVVGAWVALWSLRGVAKPQGQPALVSWLPRLIAGGALAVGITMVKFGPSFQFMNGDRETLPQEAGWSWATLPTLFFPYDSVDGLPFDVSMRPLFVVAPVLILALLGVRRSAPPVVVTTAVVIVMSALASFPTNFLTALPGGTLSRFQVVDLKPFLTCLLAILGGIGLDAWARQRGSVPTWLAGSVVAVAAVLGMSHAPWTSTTALVTYSAMLVVITLSAWVLTRRERGFWPLDRHPVAPIIIMALVSGMGFAYTTTGPWLAKREKTEIANYGSTVSELTERSACGTSPQRRPDRIAAERMPVDGGGTLALRGAWSCEVAVGGYVNYKGVEVMLHQAQLLGQSSDLVRFYSAGGAVVPVRGSAVADLSDDCLGAGRCVGLTVQPVSYDRSGRITYRILAEGRQQIAFNESYYPGWQATLCDTSGENCEESAVGAGPGESISIEIPDGAHQVLLEYSVPRQREWQSAALLSVLALGCWGAITGIRSRRKAVTRPSSAPDEDHSRVSLR